MILLEFSVLIPELKQLLLFRCQTSLQMGLRETQLIRNIMQMLLINYQTGDVGTYIGTH